MKRILSILLCLLTLCGCAAINANRQQTVTYWNLFDTVTTLSGTADSQEELKKRVEPIYQELERYHKLFDIYNEYDGISNLKTVNDTAADAPVKVDIAILELLQDCKNYYTATDGQFNVAMGSVLRLWHTAREQGIDNPKKAYLPDLKKLKAAAQHTNPEDIVLDFEDKTVSITDPELKIDVGAIAKGWAVQRVAKSAPKGLLISVGGNVCATGTIDGSGTPWSVGIANPDGGENLHVLSITSGSVVTSGSYNRAYTVDGKQYHHIIDPNTLYPAEKWASVTIFCDDSAVADMLSTSLFLLERQAGQELLNKYSAEAMWVDINGKMYYSAKFKDLIKG